jgi:hypothetical protein
MVTLSIPSDYLARLAAKMRGVQAREAEVDIATGSNAADDRMIDAVQDTPGDLSREEIGREIMGLNERQQANWWRSYGQAGVMPNRKLGKKPFRWRVSDGTLQPRATCSGKLWPLNIGKKAPSFWALRLGARPSSLRTTSEADNSLHGSSTGNAGYSHNSILIRF